MPTETTKTVAQIAIENRNAAREFEKLGIDYCCGGRQTLDEACVAAKLPMDEVLARLEKLRRPASFAERLAERRHGVHGRVAQQRGE